ncbi:MAG: hypothetical protein ACXWBL_07725 [Usitatibacter sp.]
MNKKNIAAAALAGASALDAGAARPMITDDARIVDSKACQVESWIKRNRDSTEFWALPACNPTGNVELTFGGARTRENGESAFTDEQVQAKTIFRPLETNGWGVGLAVGTVRHPRREVESGWPGDVYFYVPASFSYLDDKWVVHVNAGVTRLRDEGRNLATWGATSRHGAWATRSACATTSSSSPRSSTTPRAGPSTSSACATGS